jgi:hypothetical protein
MSMQMQMHMPMRQAFTLICFTLILAAGNCEEGGGGGGLFNGGENGGSENGEGNGGGTGGPVDLGCSDDAHCGSGEICDLGTGDCVAGFDCSNNNTICAFCDGNTQDCGLGGAASFCDVEAGVCRRTKGTCSPCTDDGQCGTSARTGLPNKCADGFCADGCGTCPSGFQCQNGGCVPWEEAGTCASAIFCSDSAQCPDGQQCSDLGVCLTICQGDGDCEIGKVCWDDANDPRLGLCINGCTKGATRNAGAEICHANGRFGEPCSNPGTPDNCPAGLECDAEGICELPGCQSDAECQTLRTYCDVSSGQCVDGCNDESDCGAFELCEEGQCVKQGCRGKDVSCNLGQWCCGKERYETEACPAGVEDGACFLAPDPWCRSCEDNDDCADINEFGHSSYCYELQREDENGETVSLGKFCSVGCNSNADCPRGISCQMELPTDQEGVTTQGCIDSICAAFAEGM